MPLPSERLLMAELLALPYVDRITTWRRRVVAALDVETEPCAQSKVAIATSPAPVGCSIRSGWPPSASHAVARGLTVPNGPSTFAASPSAVAFVRTTDAVACIGMIG